MNSSLLQSSRDTSGFHNIFSISTTPFDVGGISFLEDEDRLFIEYKFLILSLDCSIELAMDGTCRPCS